MAVEPTMRPLGTPLPEFDLVDTVSSERVSSRGLGGRALMVIFLCNHPDDAPSELAS